MQASSSSFEGGVLKHNPNYDLRTESTAKDINFTFPIAPNSGVRIQQTDVAAQEILYWQPKKQLKGNLLTLYENKIYFDVYYKEEETGGNKRDVSVILFGRKNDRYVFNIGQVHKLIYNKKIKRIKLFAVGGFWRFDSTKLFTDRGGS